MVKTQRWPSVLWLIIELRQLGPQTHALSWLSDPCMLYYTGAKRSCLLCELLEKLFFSVVMLPCLRTLSVMVNLGRIRKHGNVRDNEKNKIFLAHGRKWRILNKLCDWVRCRYECDWLRDLDRILSYRLKISKYVGMTKKNCPKQKQVT